jgi:ATP-dependent helicase/nuclease subunit A
MPTLPEDQPAREQFATELERNFSVVAAAGTGKTTAITERIANIAQREPEWLARLVVVTFTNRAADEMQQRVRQRIFEQNPAPRLLAAFNRAFFGTIHSFCAKLLAQHAHHLGLPPRLEVIEDDEELWNEFVQQTKSIGESLSPENRKALLRHVLLRDLMELGRRGGPPFVLRQRELAYPERLDLAALHHFPAQATWARIIALKELVGKWEKQFNSGADFLPLIECTAEGRFLEQWEESLREFNKWLSCDALKVAAEVQAKYRQFRAEHGVVTFDDQVTLALRLMENAEVISRIRAQDYIVILDEAQDTDPQQFEILTEITRPPEAKGRWIDDRQDPPRPGRFCMVGDFQQSIYSTRADLNYYRRVHDALISSDAGEELRFSVTFRLDQKQVDFVNKCFPAILNKQDGQVDFIPLVARPKRLPGQVVRLDMSAEGLPDDARELQKARAEAEQLARWLRQTTLERIRARSWDQVAILCPRKRWLSLVADALRVEGIALQIHSETELKGDNPAHAWFSALLTIMIQPRSAFEIVGVLREVFGIADHELAVFASGGWRSARFQIKSETDGDDVVSKTLSLLARVHAKVASQPLFTSVAQIVEATKLRERLHTLPKEHFDGLDHELDALLQSAADAEAQGQTLEEFAEFLRANFAAEREARAPRPGAIQLITCQKAKGLEWDAVIVPFLYRQIRTAEDDFPRVIAPSRTDEAIVAFRKSAVPAQVKRAVKEACRREMERVLYVALTRARHTLVLASDRELFGRANGAAPDASLAQWLGADQAEQNQPHIDRLPIQLSACGKTRAHQLRLIAAEKEQREIEALPEPVLDVARSRGCEFFRQLNPSKLLTSHGEIERTDTESWKETELEFRARTVPSAATRYGVWWHECARNVPWNAQQSAWQRIFNENLERSPKPDRSRREWKLLSERLAARRDLFAGNILAEMPFLWRMNQHECLEGIVDLAVFDPWRKKWFLLDWKTNQIRPLPEEIGKLRLFYRPQMAAYWKAVSQMTGQPVSAAIYSTATGQFIFYDGEELAREWEQLRDLTQE